MTIVPFQFGRQSKNHSTLSELRQTTFGNRGILSDNQIIHLILARLFDCVGDQIDSVYDRMTFHLDKKLHVGVREKAQ